MNYLSKNVRLSGSIAVLAAALTACAAPQTRTDQGTYVGVASGAAIGAILGQVVGRNTEGTVIGATVGGALGGAIGRQAGAYMDRQEAELQAVSAQSAAMSIARIQEANTDVLMATFKSDVLFDSNSFALKPGAYAEMDRVAGVLQRYPQTTVRVEGHTDQRGSEQYNQQLSEKRAESVKKVLISRGIQASRLQAIGYGESVPMSSSDAMNRRVQLVIIPN